MPRVFFAAVVALCLVQVQDASPTPETGTTDLLEPPSVDIWISMKEKDSVRRIIEQVSQVSFPSASEKRVALRHALLKNAEDSQAQLLRYLEKVVRVYPSQVTSFWITNQIHLRNVSLTVREALIGHEDVGGVHVVNLHRFRGGLHQRPLPLFSSELSHASEPVYNIEAIKAPEVWKEGVKGSGVVVAIIDTGVHADHEALRASFKHDAYSWYDPVHGNSMPYDDHSHGTMSMGLLVGGQGIGVAPGAKWIACKGMDEKGQPTEEWVKKCAQFLFCPDEHDCSHTPHVISVGFNDPDLTIPWLDEVMEVMDKADVLVVSSAGDYGERGCSAIGFPGHHSSILAVGAIDSDNIRWANSSQGASPKNESIKPDIVAPGVNVLSACIGDVLENTYSYCNGSGTAFAALQVAGVAALLLSTNSSLSPKEVREILRNTASRNLTSSDEECGGIPDMEFPNYQFGHGLVDAFAAYKCAKDPEHACLVTEEGPEIPDHEESKISMQLLWIFLGVVGGAVTLTWTGFTFLHIRRERRRKASTTATATTVRPPSYQSELSTENPETGIDDIEAIDPPYACRLELEAEIPKTRGVSFADELELHHEPPSPDPSYEQRPATVMDQFRSGMWKTIVYRDESVRSGGNGKAGDNQIRESNTSTRSSGNYTALTRPYDFEQYELAPERLEIDEDRVLGMGGFGVVYSGVLQEKTNSTSTLQVAVKKLRVEDGDEPDPQSVEAFLKELQIMAFVGRHENIVQLLGACTRAEDMCMVLGLCANGNLKNYLRARRSVFVSQSPNGSMAKAAYVTVSGRAGAHTLTELSPITTIDLVRWVSQIAAGMEFLADKYVVHGDLAARNVLLDDGLNVKISDFGLASKLCDYAFAKMRGKTETRPLPWRWMALEALRDLDFSTASDVWSFGITAWEIFSLAEVPYPRLTWGPSFMAYLAMGYRNVRPKHGTPELFECMERCWDLDPEKRPRMTELRIFFSNALEKLVAKAEADAGAEL